MQCKARPQDGRPNAKLIRNEKRPHKGALVLKTSWRMDKTNFGLEVDFLMPDHQGWAPQRNARHVRKMGTQTQHKDRPQVGRPNAT
jgi:hypothetical protein